MQNHNILIVDDDLITQRLYEAYLKDPTFRVLKALSGKECFQQVHANPVSLIILDIGIPDMNGYEIAAQLKLSVETSEIPIIFITGNTDSSFEAGKGYELGAVDFLTKPVDAKTLRRKTTALVKTYEKHKMALTELEGAKKTNRELEERLKAIFSVYPRVIFILDKSGVITDCSARAERLFVLTKSEIAGRQFMTFLSEQCRAEFPGALGKAFSSGSRQEFTCAFARNSGSDIPARAFISVNGQIALCEIGPEQPS